MKSHYVVKVNKDFVKRAESILLNYLVDRTDLCSLIKLIEMNNDKKNQYIVISGEDFSCKVVLSRMKKLLTSQRVNTKIYPLETMKNSGMESLVYYLNANDCGRVVKDYYSNPLITNYLKRQTTKFILEKKLMSKHVFCNMCDGFADAIELSSLKGIYKCSFCDNEIIVEGPLLTGKAPINHLSEKEQLYLIGLPSITAPLENFVVSQILKGEQLAIPFLSKDEPSNLSKKKRRKYKNTKGEEVVFSKANEQLYMTTII